MGPFAEITVFREIYSEALARLDADYGARLAADLPLIAQEEVGFGPADVVPAAEAWPVLEAYERQLVDQAEQVVARRGSAEWIWWLRRLRGQFHINDLRTTEPYAQTLAEVLAAGNTRPSTPVDGPRLNFVRSGDDIAAGVDDLLSLRHAAIQLYRLHATMKRCAKGQGVIFPVKDLPRAEIDTRIEAAIHAYDQRNEAGSSNSLFAVGLHLADPSSPPSPSDRFGGTVPIWHEIATPIGDPIDLGDPPPALFSMLDLERIAPFELASPLDESHVAIILLLWACLNVMTREPQKVRDRSAAAIQFGYSVVVTDNYLRPALDEAVEWLQSHRSPVIPRGLVPSSGAEVEATLRALGPSTLPLMTGSPLHPVGDSHTLVDLVGASRRLLFSLARPVDGADVNFWSNQFEHDVQSLVDESIWRPTDELRTLIGRSIRRRDGSTLSDIDAVARKDGDLVLLSCKSIAFRKGHQAGDYGSMLNIRQRTEQAIDHWDRVIAELRSDPGLLNVSLPEETTVHGVVVLPFTPWVIEPQHYSPTTPLATPPAISTDELARALEQHST